jgi:hypothetical protein
MGVWQGVAMDSLKFHLGPPCPTILCPVDGPPLKCSYGRLKGGPLAECVAVYPFGHPTPYAYDRESLGRRDDGKMKMILPLDMCHVCTFIQDLLGNFKVLPTPPSNHLVGQLRNSHPQDNYRSSFSRYECDTLFSFLGFPFFWFSCES